MDGGDIDLTSTAGPISIRGQVAARGTGSNASARTVSVDAAASAMLAGTSTTAAAAMAAAAFRSTARWT